MPLDRLGVVVDDDDGDALFFQTIGIETKGFVLPVRQNHQIGIEAQHFFDRESLRFHFTDIGNVGK